MFKQTYKTTNFNLHKCFKTERDTRTWQDRSYELLALCRINRILIILHSCENHDNAVFASGQGGEIRVEKNIEGLNLKLKHIAFGEICKRSLVFSWLAGYRRIPIAIECSSSVLSRVYLC